MQKDEENLRRNATLSAKYSKMHHGPCKTHGKKNLKQLLSTAEAEKRYGNQNTLFRVPLPSDGRVFGFETPNGNVHV